MKVSLILILFFLFLTSCQNVSKVVQQSSVQNNYKNLQIEHSPTPTASPTPKKKINEINQNVGVVDFNKQSNVLCFRTMNADLKKNTPIIIVDSLYYPPQKWLTAKVEEKLKKSCVNGDSDAGDYDPKSLSYYALKLSGDHTGLISIGVINPTKQGKIEGKSVVLDIDGDGKNEYFRICTSSEGTHLTIWTGKPLKGKRVWHYYYYLGYDTVSSCKKADYEGTA